MNKSICATYRQGLRLVFLALFIGTGTTVSAQRDFTLYSLSGTPQAHYINPAFRPTAKVFISLPLGMQSFSVTNSGFTLNQLLQKRSQDDSLEFNPSNAIDKMAKLNYLTVESHNEILGFGFALKKNYFSFSVTNRFQSNLVYPKDLFRFAFEGNGKSYLGTRASLDGFGFNLTSYVEYALGFNREISDKLSVGARFKLLSGIANVRTKKSQLGIYTDATTFDITIDGALDVRTSGIKPFYDTLADDNYNPINNAFSFKNSGIALDLGATYKLTDKITLSASLLDLGTIKWTTDNANFVSKDVNYHFEGVDLNEYLNDSTNTFIDQLADSLKDVFSQKENAESYRTGLYTRFYLGGTFKLTEKFFVGATLYNEFIKARYRPGLILSGNVKLNNWFAATVNYSAYARSYGNVGVGFTVKGGPIQFYVISDNVMGFLAPAAAKNFHISTGLNILIGGRKDKESKNKG
jgi:hypothetical protein